MQYMGLYAINTMINIACCIAHNIFMKWSLISCKITNTITTDINHLAAAMPQTRMNKSCERRVTVSMGVRLQMNTVLEF